MNSVRESVDRKGKDGHFTLDQVLPSYLLVKESWGAVVKNTPASAEDAEMWA